MILTINKCNNDNHYNGNGCCNINEGNDDDDIIIKQ